MSWRKEKKEHPWTSKAQAKRIASDHAKKSKRKMCKAKDCKISDGLCLTHGYSVSDKVKCTSYPEPLRVAKKDFSKMRNGYKAISTRRVI